MSEILFDYERVNPTSWAYLSSLLTIALFFKFNRVACVRNLGSCCWSSSWRPACFASS